MDIKYYKPKRPYDFLPHDPIRAIEEVWGARKIDLLMKELADWFFMCLSDPGSMYDDCTYRARFIEFYTDLLPFIEATYFYDLRRDKGYTAKYLNDKNEADPFTIIRPFRWKYPYPYVMIEVWDWYEAVLCYEGPLKERIDIHYICYTHLHLLTLLEACYLIVGAEE